MLEEANNVKDNYLLLFVSTMIVLAVFFSSFAIYMAIEENSHCSNITKQCYETMQEKKHQEDLFYTRTEVFKIP